MPFLVRPVTPIPTLAITTTPSSRRSTLRTPSPPFPPPARTLPDPSVPFPTTGSPPPGVLRPPVGGPAPAVNGPAIIGSQSFHGLDPNFVPPYAHEAQLAVEQALPGHMSLSVG